MPHIVKQALILLILLSIAFGGAVAFAHTKLPAITDQTFREKIAALGFENAVIPEPESRFGALRYHDIILSPNEQSEIGAVTLHYGVIDLILKKSIGHAEIHNLSLSGEIDQSGKLTLQGINTPSALMRLRQSNIRKISLKNATISLLSAHLGGVRLTTDMQIKNGKNEAEWSGHIESKQSQMELVAKINGEIQKDGEWFSDIEIDNGKLERDFGKITRLSGNAQFQGNERAITQINSNIRAGSMVISGLPWKNANITIDGTPQDLKIFTSGNSIGFEGLELSGETQITNLMKQNQAITSNIRIYVEKLGYALDLLKAQNLLPVPRENLELLTEETDIEFGTSYTAQGLKFNIRNIEKNIDINGLITKTAAKSYKVQFTSAPMAMAKMNTLSSSVDEGQMLLSGDFTIKDNIADGTIKAEIKDAALKRGALKLSGVGGAIVIDDLRTFSATKDPVLTCAKTKNTDDSCEIALNLEDGKLSVQDAVMNMFGGKISVSPQKENGEQTILLENIALEKLLQSSPIKGTQAKGRIEGIITFSSDEKGQTTIHKASINNDGDGWMEIETPEILNLWDGNPFEKETATQALKNYEFEDLNINASGILNGEMNLRANARGRNPDILGARPVVINIKTKTSLASILRKTDEN